MLWLQTTMQQLPPVDSVLYEKIEHSIFSEDYDAQLLSRMIEIGQSFVSHYCTLHNMKPREMFLDSGTISWVVKKLGIAGAVQPQTLPAVIEDQVMTDFFFALVGAVFEDHCRQEKEIQQKMLLFLDEVFCKELVSELETFFSASETQERFGTATGATLRKHSTTYRDRLQTYMVTTYHKPPIVVRRHIGNDTIVVSIYHVNHRLIAETSGERESEVVEHASYLACRYLKLITTK